MKHITKGLFHNSLNLLGSKKVLSLLPTLQASAAEERALYDHAQKSGDTDVLVELSRKYSIQSEFRFLNDFFAIKSTAKEFHLLARPYFNTDQDRFKDVVLRLTGKRFTNGLIKRFGQKTQEYGLTFLNNVYELNSISDIVNISMDQMLNLDFSSPLPRHLREKILGNEYILLRYPLPRMLKLLTNADDDVIRELRHLEHYALRLGERFEQVLPRKPKSLVQIHDLLNEAILNRTIQNRAKTKEIPPNEPLDQELAYLNGLSFLEFSVEVPLESYDLINTSDELKHCVHTYVQKVIKKECHIINLKKENKRIYTIELHKYDHKFVIIQFKGLRNDSSMQQPEAEAFRNQLLEFIHEKSIKEEK